MNLDQSIPTPEQIVGARRALDTFKSEFNLGEQHRVRHGNFEIVCSTIAGMQAAVQILANLEPTVVRDSTLGGSINPRGLVSDPGTAPLQQTTTKSNVTPRPRAPRLDPKSQILKKIGRHKVPVRKAAELESVLSAERVTMTPLTPAEISRFRRTVLGCQKFRYWEIVIAICDFEALHRSVSDIWLGRRTTAKSAKELRSMIHHLRNIAKTKGAALDSDDIILLQNDDFYQLAPRFALYLESVLIERAYRKENEVSSVTQRKLNLVPDDPAADKLRITTDATE